MGLSVQNFHERSAQRARSLPDNLLCTATHDSKRGEDTRMRLLVLSELVEPWRDLVAQLHRAGRAYISQGNPNRHDRYALMQLLVALWPATDNDLLARLQATMRKSAREAKRQTSWTNPNQAYEAALEAYVRGMLQDVRVGRLLQAFTPQLQRCGNANGISQLVLKCTALGVPDFYQGSDLLDLSLVDPDNRRPVDFGRRRRLLADLANLVAQPDLPQLRRLRQTDPDAFKLSMTARLLHLRRHSADLQRGTYRSLAVSGADADHLLAYARGATVVVVSRYFVGLEALGRPLDASVQLPVALQHKKLQEQLSGTPVQAGSRLNGSALPLPWALLAVAAD